MAMTAEARRELEQEFQRQLDGHREEVNGLEAVMAEQLEEIAAQLRGVARRLRRQPFAVVEAQLKRQQERLRQIEQAGKLISRATKGTASDLMRLFPQLWQR